MSTQETAQAARPTDRAPAQVARVPRIWVALAGLLLALAAITMLVSLGPYYQQLRTACTNGQPCFPPALFDHDVAVLAQYGVSLTTYATLIFLLQLAAHLGYLSLAGVLFWRRRDDPMALSAVAVLALQPLALSGYLTAVIDIEGPARLVLYAVALAAKIAVILFFALFPTGRLVPRGLCWYLPLLFVLIIGTILVEATVGTRDRLARTGIFAVETFWMINILLFQLYRYMRASTSIERRQTRWLIGLLAVYCGYKAHARRCSISIRLASGLLIEVADDGIGRPKQVAGGVGLRSMAERATELGGRLALEDRPGGGTLVRAQLPLPNSPS